VIQPQRNPKKRKQHLNLKKYDLFYSIKYQFFSSQDEPIPTTDTTKTKKKKKTTKAANLLTETPNADNDEDDLESFLSDNPKTSQKTNHDYEHI
jgi:hypothetical protein